MPMRLLPKSDVQRAKASEQKRSIDEGAKIARTIDNLREVKAQEEASLTRFRKETVATIHAEIKAATSERDAIRGEVIQLKKERKELQEPLDKEWEELKKERIRVTKEAEDARARTIAAQDAEHQSKKAIKQASNALARAATLEDGARSRLHDAANAEREAKKLVANARKVEEQALKLKEKVESELTHRDMKAAARERGVTMKEAKLKESEAALAKGWALLEDRKAAFERQIKRLKK